MEKALLSRQCKGAQARNGYDEIYSAMSCYFIQYFLDSAPSDTFLFLNLKIWFGEKKLISDYEIIAPRNTDFENLNISYCL